MYIFEDTEIWTYFYGYFMLLFQHRLDAFHFVCYFFQHRLLFSIVEGGVSSAGHTLIELCA